MKKCKIRLTAAAAAVMIAAGALAVPAAAAGSGSLRAGQDITAGAQARSDKELNAQSMNSQYLLPDSDTYYITEADISWMNDNELMLARNEFYARRGRKFALKSIREYFEKQGWYHGSIEPEAFSPDLFNRYEQANVDFIVAYENKRLKQREQKKKEQKELTVLQEIGPSTEEEEEYMGIMSLHSDSVDEDWSDEEMSLNGISELTKDMDSAESVGYMYRDLDGDGSDELLIGAMDSQLYGEGAVFEIYTIEDKTPVEVAVSDNENMFYVCGDNTIRREIIFDDGKWEIDYFDLVDGELVYKNILIMDEGRNAAEPWYVVNKKSDAWVDLDVSVNGFGGLPDNAFKHITSKEASNLRASYVSEELDLSPMR